MAQNLQKLNEDLRKRKAKKKVTKKKTVRANPVDKLVAALEKVQQPQVIVEARKPTSYRVTVDINSRGDMTGAQIDPVIK